MRMCPRCGQPFYSANPAHHLFCKLCIVIAHIRRPKRIKPRKPRKPRLVAERFWAKVDKTTCLGSICGCHQGLGCCWGWIAGKQSFGYGSFKYNKRAYVAHRVRYALMNSIEIEALPKEIYVLHACDVPSCVRHLFPGNAKENALDAKRKGRPLGRPWRFTKEQRLLIKTLCETMTHSAIAQQFGISTASVSRLHNRDRALII